MRVSSFITVFLTVFVISCNLSCNLSRSPLVRSDNFNKNCKMALECGYLYQNNETVSQCLSIFGPACKKINNLEYCENRDGDTVDKKLCRAYLD